MDRRWGGVLVLVVAIVAALAGNARTKLVAGHGLTEQLPDPPAVGDCVLEALSESVLNAFDRTVEIRDFPSARISPCTGSRYGEVVAVLDTGLDYTAPSDGDVWGDPKSPANRCSSAVELYLGVPAADDRSSRWSPTASVAVAGLGPGPVLTDAGQRWVACVVVSLAESANDPRGTQRFTGTLQDALETLRLPPQLAQCAPSLPDPTLGSVSMIPCDRPHSAELLGFAWSDRPDNATKSRLAHECPELIGMLTGLADPTAHGRLRVRATSMQLPPDASDTDPDAVGPVYYYCGVEATSGLLLTGPMLGLDNGPLPIG